MTPEERNARAELLGLLATRAQDGDREALQGLMTAVRDDVYRLALRMTGHPVDAEDATQEVLVKVITNLSSWRGEARITTWIHRVTVNLLLDRRRSLPEHRPLGFDEFGADLLDGLAAPSSAPGVDPVEQVLLDDVRLGCTLAMLQCLDRDHRIAYILGELFEVPGEDAAWICDISPTAYRKRLSRARERVRQFLTEYCGLVGDQAPCSCAARAPHAVALGRIDPSAPALAVHPVTEKGELRRRAYELRGEADRLRDAAAVMRAHPDYAAPESLNTALRALLEGSALLAPGSRRPRISG